MADSPRNSGARTGGARRRILESAARRFYLDGIAATGVDAITADAGVAKMSLYNNFASKSALVCASLEARHAEWLALYVRRARRAADPVTRTLAVFDAYLDQAALAPEPGYRGSALLNAAAELPLGDPGREIVRRHSAEVDGILAAGLRELTDRARAERVAQQLSYILHGALARSGLEADRRRLRDARTLALDLLTAL
ncbi:TetR/AcrR family transcriptional regulator [Leifsonia shinshuensis]|uniref:TetR/AcrR family transcriptional regulator n=1 Tax=Leifsonia shinshuensis TaxID=150026 RepID=UPI001F506241|nr:TetR/AcrR family transcriptional regulator [Leifsonia shinshuensis]MCI0156604.1 TetR/AcrR family transcriptional regulator [Leifsonia shinshuensis]